MSLLLTERSHLSAHYDAHHALLYEGSSTADVRTVGSYQLAVLGPLRLVRLPLLLVDVAVLYGGELVAQDQRDHLLPQHGAGQASQPGVDVVLQDLTNIWSFQQNK